ncbi:MAG: hypothetical protein AVDCRST_MAG49-4160, partial [uncultured Thermomicrobiales bacterium]
PRPAGAAGAGAAGRRDRGGGDPADRRPAGLGAARGRHPRRPDRRPTGGAGVPARDRDLRPLGAGAWRPGAGGRTPGRAGAGPATPGPPGAQPAPPGRSSTRQGRGRGSGRLRPGAAPPRRL